MSYIAYTNMQDWVILTVHNKETKANEDQYQYLGNCPPTPPLTQH